MNVCSWCLTLLATGSTLLAVLCMPAALHAQDARPPQPAIMPPAAPPPSPFIVATPEDARWERIARKQERHEARAAQRQRKQELAVAQRAERAAEYERATAHEHAPGFLVSVGTAHAMVGSDEARPGYRTRFRQLGVELGLAFIQRYTPRAGIRFGVSGAFGPTHMSANDNPGSEADFPEVRRVRASGSLSMEVAPTIFLGHTPLYVAPGLVGRVFFLPQNHTVINVAGSEPDPVRVQFRSPAFAAGGRFMLGARLGDQRQVDVSFGLDAGAAFREAQRYFGLVLRMGVAPLAYTARGS